MKKSIIALVILFCLGGIVSAPAAATLLTLQVGMEGPIPTLDTLDGKPVKYAELQGEKLTVLVFWSSWIKKSEALLTRMQQLFAQHASAGLSVVGVNVDEQHVSPQTVDTVKQTRDKLKIQYPMLIDSGLVTFRDYGVMALPTTVVLDKNRVVKQELSGYPLIGAEELADFISATVAGKKPSVPSKPHYQPAKSAINYYNMGLATLKSRTLAGMAETWFKKAVEADAGFILPHLGLATLYSARGNVEPALAEYRAVLAREPEHPVALCESAIILIDKGMPGEGLALLDAARKSEDAYAPCFFYAGYAMGLAGKQAESGKMFEEAARLAPNDYRVNLYRAKMLEKKDVKEAAEEYRRALEKAIDRP